MHSIRNFTVFLAFLLGCVHADLSADVKKWTALITNFAGPTTKGLTGLKLISKESTSFMKAAGPAAEVFDYFHKLTGQASTPEMDAITALAETLQQGLFNISYSISEAEAKIKYADLKVRLNENVFAPTKFLLSTVAVILNTSHPTKSSFGGFIGLCQGDQSPWNVLNVLATYCVKLCPKHFLDQGVEPRDASTNFGPFDDSLCFWKAVADYVHYNNEKMDSAADMIRYYLARLEILAGLCSGVAVSEAAAEAERNSAAEKVEFIASGSATAIEYIMDHFASRKRPPAEVGQELVQVGI